MSAGGGFVSMRVALAGVLLAWVCKLSWLVPAVRLAHESPLVDPFFPRILRDARVLGLASLVPPCCALLALLRPARRHYALAFALHIAGALTLLVHQATYNDASYLTAFWSALYGLWLVVRSRDADDVPRLVHEAGLLARMLVALLFLGGFVGKLTPTYWDGSVMYDLYFESRGYFPYRLARAVCTPEQLRTLALVYSRFVICSEGLLVTLPLWPARPALTFALAAMGSIVLLSNPYLLSVLGPPMGACAAALYVGLDATGCKRLVGT